MLNQTVSATIVASATIAGLGMRRFEEAVESLSTVVPTLDEVVGDLDQITDRDDIEFL